MFLTVRGCQKCRFRSKIVATYYPDNNNQELLDRISELEKQNRELNIALMRKSAEASVAREKLKRCKLEWEIVADQTGHNLCWVAIARALKVTIGHTGKYPDPDNVSPEQFARGCIEYHKRLFGDCGIELAFMRYKPDQK